MTPDQIEIILRLLLIAVFKDDDTGAHVCRVGALASRLAALAGQSEKYCSDIFWAAPLHDIGKVGIPDAILKKPGKLTESELVVMRTHAELGARLLACTNVPVLHLAAEIAKAHHERVDGGGYPFGLRNHAIPLGARIVAIVDCFDALTMNRCYRAALSIEQAMDIMEDQVGLHFDSVLFGIFREHIDDFAFIRERLTHPSGPQDYEQLANLCVSAKEVLDLLSVSSEDVSQEQTFWLQPRGEVQKAVM